MEKIKLDLIPSGKMPSLHASQYDDGRDYHIDLTENRAPYTLDGTETISLTVRKCDNTLVTMDIANTFADKSYIEFRTTEQMNACAGFNYGEITIEKNGTQISSLNFYLQVEGAPDEGGIQSQSEINNLKRQVHDAVVEELEDNGASETGYDNTESGLEATNVQDAIDELASATPEDVYTKEETDDKFATKTALEEVAGDIPTKTSDLQNDSGFTTIDDSETANNKAWSSEKINDALNGKANESDFENVEARANYGTVVINKARLHQDGAIYENYPIKASSDVIGKNYTDVIDGHSQGANLYKIDIENVKILKLPMFRTGSVYGSVITDKDGIILKTVYNATEPTGTIFTVNVGLPNAKYLIFGTSAELELLSFSIEIILENLTAKRLNSAILNNNLIYTLPIDVDWEQNNISPNGNPQTSAIRCHTRTLIVDSEFGYIHLKENGKKLRITFFNSKSTHDGSTLVPSDSNTNWTNEELFVEIPATAKSYALSAAFINDANIVPSDCASISVELVNCSTINEFRGKTISVLGDSISTYAGANAPTAGDGHKIADGTYTFAGNHCRYPNNYLSNVNDTYWKKLVDFLGLKLGVNDSWAGSCVSWDGTETSDKGANIYIASQTRIGHLDDNGTPDYILVNAGTNDIGLAVTVGTFNTDSPVNYTDAQIASLSVATFADAYRAMLIRLQKTYPLAKIVVMLPNYTTSYYGPATADAYLEVIKEACDYFGVPYIDMRTTGITMFNVGTYTGDGIHPNVKGMNLLFRTLLKFFRFKL